MNAMYFMLALGLGLGMAAYHYFTGTEQQRQRAYGYSNNRGNDSDDDDRSTYSNWSGYEDEETRRRRYDCMICLCKMIAGGINTKTLPCSHTFHEKCINLWFQNKPNCPICRR